MEAFQTATGLALNTGLHEVSTRCDLIPAQGSAISSILIVLASSTTLLFTYVKCMGLFGILCLFSSVYSIFS